MSLINVLMSYMFYKLFPDMCYKTWGLKAWFESYDLKRITLSYTKTILCYLRMCTYDFHTEMKVIDGLSYVYISECLGEGYSWNLVIVQYLRAYEII